MNRVQRQDGGLEGAKHLRLPLHSVCVCMLVPQSRPTLTPQGLKPARVLCPWVSPGNNTGVGCHALLQGSFPTQGSNPGLLYCKQIIYRLNYQ